MNKSQFLAELGCLCAIRNSHLTNFARQVASSIFDTLQSALRDHSVGRSCLQVSSAPTGSGKSSSALAFMSAAWKIDQTRSALVVETVAQAEAAFRELRSLVDDDVAVWTSMHDADRPVLDRDVYEEKGFIPLQRYFRDHLKEYPIVIVTHAFFEGKNGGLAADGRHLIIYDEKPKDVTIFDLGHDDFAAFRDGVLSSQGPQSDLYQAARELWKFADDIYEHGGAQGGNGLFEPLMRHQFSHCLNQIAALADDQEKLVSLLCPSLDIERLKAMCGFAKSLASGYAFLWKYNCNRIEGCRFVGYSMDFPLRPGMALLDATSDIDGVSQLVPWRAHPVPCPQVNYSRLTLHPIEPPAELQRTPVSKIVVRRDLIEQWREWLIQMVLQHTSPGNDVLVVTHKRLIPHLPSSNDPEDQWRGRLVRYCNWGNGIGSNQWRMCQHVFLIGEFFIPKRATVASCLGLTTSRPSAANLRDAQDIQGLKGSFRHHQEGHLLRWTKQLACRGSVRNIDEDGVCGPMHLYVTGEFSRVVSHCQTLFPGCRLLPRDTSANPKVQQLATEPFISRLTSCLLGTSEEELSTKAVEALARCRIDGHVSWLTGSEGQRLLRHIGWRFIPGKRGRGNHARFVKIADLSVFEMEDAA